MATNERLSGRLLLASPYLTEGHFFRSVILVLHHDDDGALGVVLNRPTDRRITDVTELTTENDLVGSALPHPASGDSESGQPASGDSAGSPSGAAADDRIYCGGPCAGPLLVVHDRVGIGDPCGAVASFSPGAGVSVSITPGAGGASSTEIWVTGDHDQARLLLRVLGASLRWITDYSGWGPGQLERELETGGWIVCDVDADAVFGHPDDAWQRQLRRFGRSVMGEVVPMASSDEFDPERN